VFEGFVEIGPLKQKITRKQTEFLSMLTTIIARFLQHSVKDISK